MHIRDYIERVHKINEEKGWNEDGRTVGDDCALMTSEISEILEDFRDGRAMTEVYYEDQPNGTMKPCGIPIELADLFVRGMDFAARHDIDLEAALDEKIAFNATRPYRHGGRKL
jgi:hypothetical protein